MMLVRNEADRYLTRVLDHLSQYVDNIVIFDDASTDNTPDICESYNKATVIRLNNHGFANEWVLRKFCWDETLKTNPDWILAIDADEIFEDKAITEMRRIIEIPNVDAWSFRLYDLWGSEEYYRDDNFWCAHNQYRIFLIKNLPNVNYVWSMMPVHCGRVPCNIGYAHRIAQSDLRLKHYGWANADEHIKKFNRYMEWDGQGRYGNLAQYYSILDKSPNLVKWVE